MSAVKFLCDHSYLLRYATVTLGSYNSLFRFRSIYNFFNIFLFGHENGVWCCSVSFLCGFLKPSSFAHQITEQKLSYFMITCDHKARVELFIYLTLVHLTYARLMVI